MLRRYFRGQKLKVMMWQLFVALVVPHMLPPRRCATFHPALAKQNSHPSPFYHLLQLLLSSLFTRDRVAQVTLYPLIVKILELFNPLKHFPKSKRERKRERDCLQIIYKENPGLYIDNVESDYCLCIGSWERTETFSLFASFVHRTCLLSSNKPQKGEQKAVMVSAGN